MTVSEAQRAVRAYYRRSNPGEDDEFAFTEALRYLIEETKDPGYMVELGGFYYEKRRFDLAAKYYGLAAECGSVDAHLCLGYIWYYGRIGEPDYEKAFYHYDKARQAGSPVAAYKVADMYRNGYYVDRDMDRYKAIIEELYSQVRHISNPNAPVPEVFTRLAKIRSEEGKTSDALRLYDAARDFLARRIRCNPFFGNLSIMKWMVDDIYKLRRFDPENIQLYDLYYLLQRPVRVEFSFETGRHRVEAVREDDGLAICFDGRWFRTVDDFFQKAEIDGELLTARYDELYDYEVTYGSDQEQ